jgi:hypothetical protein
MKIYEFRNSKGELEFSVNAYDKTGKEQIEKFFKKDLDLINKELKEFNCITKDGETYTMSTMFIDF